MSKELNLIITGLSGQGIVMVGRVLSTALLTDGNKVIISDEVAITHRNSPTHTEIRVGEEAYSLTIGEGEADMVVAFEASEGLKAGLIYAKNDALVLLNDLVVTRTSDGSAMSNILSSFERAGIKNVKVFPGTELAQKEVGRLIALNMVMLGATVATGKIPVRPETVEATIQELSPKGAAEINLSAFRAGMKHFKEQPKKARAKAAA